MTLRRGDAEFGGRTFKTVFSAPLRLCVEKSFPRTAVTLNFPHRANELPACESLIVQGDHTILAEVASPLHTEARDALARFAELVKAPEHVHTYRLTPLSIWNACAAGVPIAEMAKTLVQFSKYPVPEHVLIEIRDYASRYGRLKLLRGPRGLVLEANDEFLAEQISRNKHVAPWLGVRFSPLEFGIAPAARGEIKQALIKAGFPAEDLAGYSQGETLAFSMRHIAGSARHGTLYHRSQGSGWCGQTTGPVHATESFSRALPPLASSGNKRFPRLRVSDRKARTEAEAIGGERRCGLAAAARG